MIRKIVVAAVCVSVVLVFGCYSEGGERFKAMKLVGQQAPDFTLVDLEGKKVVLSELKGKVVFLDFWATWCKPCLKMIPKLVHLQREYADKGFTIVGVAMDEGGKEVIKPFAERFALNYIILLSDGQADETYLVEVFPTSFLIDREGVIRELVFAGEDRETGKPVIVAFPTERERDLEKLILKYL